MAPPGIYVGGGTPASTGDILGHGSGGDGGGEWKRGHERAVCCVSVADWDVCVGGEVIQR